MTSGLTLNTDDVIQVMTGTGAGWGDPLERPLEQANRYYGLDKRSKESK